MNYELALLFLMFAALFLGFKLISRDKFLNGTVVSFYPLAIAIQKLIEMGISPYWTKESRELIQIPLQSGTHLGLALLFLYHIGAPKQIKRFTLFFYPSLFSAEILVGSFVHPKSLEFFQMLTLFSATLPLFFFRFQNEWLKRSFFITTALAALAGKVLETEPKLFGVTSLAFLQVPFLVYTLTVLIKQSRSKNRIILLTHDLESNHRPKVLNPLKRAA